MLPLCTRKSQPGTDVGASRYSERLVNPVSLRCRRVMSPARKLRAGRGRLVTSATVLFAVLEHNFMGVLKAGQILIELAGGPLRGALGGATAAQPAASDCGSVFLVALHEFSEKQPLLGTVHAL